LTSTKEVFLAKGEKFPTLKEEKKLPTPQGFFKYECEFYLKQPLTPPQLKTIIAYRTTNHRLAIEIGW
jgi:hypothetical protein